MAGYWKGTAIIEDDDGGTRDAIALIDEQGDAQLLILSSRDSRQFVLYGNVCCAASFDDDIAGKRFHDEDNEEASVAIGRNGSALNGQLQFRGDDYNLQLTASGEYAEGVTLTELAGVYTRSSLFGTTLTLSIAGDGSLNGSDSNGCVMNGSVAVIDPARNMVRLRVDMDSCSNRGDSSNEWNGPYSGLGLLLRDSLIDGRRTNVLFHSLVGPTWLGPQSVGR